MLRRLSPLLLSVLLLCACRGTRGAAPLFVLEDPRGDDHGDGQLRYPQREDMGPGTLDLLSLRAFADSGGTRFEATFARPIAVPWRRTVDAAGTTLADQARLGFYTFNLDVYVDQDRREGSGDTLTLPGRQLTLAADSTLPRRRVLKASDFVDEVLVPRTRSVGFGTVLRGNVDVSGDGVPDLLVSAPGASVSSDGGGAVFIYAGGPNTKGALAPWLTLTGDVSERSNFGQSVALLPSAGDKTKGTWRPPTVIVGAPLSYRAGTQNGTAFLVPLEF